MPLTQKIFSQERENLIKNLGLLVPQMISVTRRRSRDLLAHQEIEHRRCMMRLPFTRKKREDKGGYHVWQHGTDFTGKVPSGFREAAQLLNRNLSAKLNLVGHYVSCLHFTALEQYCEPRCLEQLTCKGKGSFP